MAGAFFNARVQVVAAPLNKNSYTSSKNLPALVGCGGVRLKNGMSPLTTQDK